MKHSDHITRTAWQVYQLAMTADGYLAYVKRKGWNQFLPVERDGRYALCVAGGEDALLTGFVYDEMFRYLGGGFGLFVVSRDGKKGLIEQATGKEVIPCEMDEIYEMLDADGVIPFRKGEKWGLYDGLTATAIIYDDVLIQSECYVQVKLGEMWFYINAKGCPVADISEVAFGSWYDISK